MASTSGRNVEAAAFMVSDSLITEIIEEEDQESEMRERMSTEVAIDISPAILPACNCQSKPPENSPAATPANTTQESASNNQSPKADRATQVSAQDPPPPAIEHQTPFPVGLAEVPARIDYRSRKPVITLTVPIPVTPELTTTDNGTLTSPRRYAEDDSDNDSDPTTPPLMRRKAPKSNFGRTRTRLLDPPPMTPAIRNQINSTLKSKKFGADEVRFNTPKTPASSAKSVSFEEEGDPLDDDSIPQYKDLNKGENPWLYRGQWISLLLLSTLLLCSVKIKKVERLSWLQLSFWRWQALTLVILSGRLIASWVVKLFVALIERRFLLRKRVLYFVYGLRKSVKNCIWIGLTLGVWETIFNGHDNTKTVRILTKVLWCLFTASVSWMLKILILKMAANSFHRSAYFERIQDCLFSQYLLETLSGPPTHGCLLEPSSRSETQEPVTTFHTESQQPSGWNSRDPESGSYNTKTRDWKAFLPFRTSPPAKGPVPIIARSPVPIEQDKLQQLTSQTVSAWTLRRLMKNIRSKNMTTYASMLSQEKAENEIDSETEARAAAKQIFYNMARPGQKYLTLKDFLYFLQEEQAARAFSLFEISDQGHITKKALMKWVVSVYKERRALALTLSDNKTVVAKLHRVFDVVLVVILLIVFLLILGVDTSKLLVFFSSIFIPMVFIFGNMAKGTFEALIFLFIVHPYDVGDRICVDGQTMLVEEMNVMNTILLTGSNEKIYYPNSVLATKAISNLHRSPDQWDAIDFQISVNTPVEKLGALKERMQRYIESLPQFWYPDFRIICKDIENSNRMIMALWIQHHLNFQEGGERFQRRSNMLLYMRQQLEDLGITYQLLRQEIMVTGVPVLDVPSK